MGNLDQLRAAVVQRLESIPALSGVPVVPEDRMHIQAEIAKALGQAGGLVLTVGTGNGNCTAPADPRPQLDIEVVVEAAEIPPINRGANGKKIPAVNLAVVAVCALHHHSWEPGKALVFDQIQYDKDDKKQLVVYTAIFKTHVAFEAQLGV